MRIIDDLKKTEDKLDEFEKSIGLPLVVPVHLEIAATKLLQVDFTTEKFTSEACRENAAILNQYAVYIRRVINRDKSKLITLRKKLKDIIAPRLSQQTAYAWEERKIRAIAEDSVAREVDSVISIIETRVQRLDELTKDIQTYAGSFNNMAWGLQKERE